MKPAVTLAKIVLASIILISLTGAAGARNMTCEVMEPAAIGDLSSDSDPMRVSQFWEAFPQPPEFDALGRRPLLDIDFYWLDNTVARLPVDAVMQPEQCDGPTRKNPTDAVMQPEQCGDPTRKNPTEAVKQPEQCDEACDRLPTQAVREPLCVECFGPTMRLTLKDDAATEIAIYSVNGRLIRRISAHLGSGENELTWDGRTDSGARAASGVYFAQVQAGADAGRGKLVLVR